MESKALCYGHAVVGHGSIQKIHKEAAHAKQPKPNLPRSLPHVLVLYTCSPHDGVVLGSLFYKLLLLRIVVPSERSWVIDNGE